MIEIIREKELVCFGFGTAVLVAHLVFFKELFQLFSDHVPIARDRNERDLFAGLGRLVGGLGLFGIIYHN